MSSHDEDFNSLAEQAGIPTDETAIRARYDEIKNDAGIDVNNTSGFGPFWRFVDNVATSATKWLIDFIISTVLPASFVKTATGTTLDIHAWSVNIERKQATKASGIIAFTRTDTDEDLTIPSGTIVESTSIDGNVFRLFTVTDAVIPSGTATIDILAEAESTGDAYNLIAGLYVTVSGELADSVSVNNSSDWLSSPGSNEETDDELRDRIRNQFSAVNQWHTDAVYTSIIAAFDGVTTDNIFFEKDAPRGPGTANAYIMLETGNPSDTFLASIESRIMDDGNHGHGDDIRVFAIPEAFYALTCDVWLNEFLEPQEIANQVSSIETYIRAAFRQLDNDNVTKVRPFSLFSFSQLSREIHDDFSALENIDFNLSHIESALVLPRLDSLTINIR